MDKFVGNEGTTELFKVARYSYHKNPALESRTQNRVTIFTRRSRKQINKMKELPKWPDVSSCSRHTTPLRVFHRVLYQLLTSLEFSILEKRMRYISLFCLVTYVQILHAVLYR
jgi:hypothetical protein